MTNNNNNDTPQDMQNLNQLFIDLDADPGTRCIGLMLVQIAMQLAHIHGQLRQLNALYAFELGVEPNEVSAEEINHE